MMEDQGEKSEIDSQVARDMQLEWKQIREAIEGLRFGQVTIVIHDGTVVQIDRTEKRRFRNSSNASQG